MDFRRLKDLREDNDLSQKNIAKILKTTQQQYSKYEIGVRIIPIDKLSVLADYYDTSIDYLIGKTDNRKAYPKKD